ncbi:methyltransferase domain-containing protein [Flavitalea flava]
MLAQLIRSMRNPSFVLDRQALAEQYISGTGIEIGALHHPLVVNRKKATVKYVDRMSEGELRIQYPELKDCKLVAVDYIADGEQLEVIEDHTQDFIIANHFIEHCQNTILAIRNMLRVLKPGGIVFFAVPDKRFTFDRNRTVTSISHMVKDYEKGPEQSREQHFKEWVEAVGDNKEENFVKTEARKLMEMDYSIHFHVWEKTDMDEFLIFLIKTLEFPFEIEFSWRNKDSIENIYILRKTNSGPF